LVDRLELTGKHQVDQWFHFESSSSPEMIQILSFAENGAWSTEEGWISHCYAERAAAPVRVFSAANGNLEITTFLLPETSPTVNQLEVTGGRGFAVQTGDTRDVVILRDRAAQLAQMGTFVSDFDCAWLRFGPQDSTPAEMVLLGGQRLELEGQKIVESSERVEHSWLRKDAAQKTYVRN
jgi:hypothetical protein